MKTPQNTVRPPVSTPSGKPKVILVGDSIRMGYAEYAAAEIGESANVWWPEENCRHCGVILENLQPWVVDPSGDIVHLNCGLHDMLLGRESGENRFTVEAYAQNLEALFSRIREATRAQLIFALTTPVLESRQQTSTTYGRVVRRDGDPARYNAAARQVAGKFQVPVNDLHQVAVDVGPEAILKEDGVHFNEAGSRILGKAVADCVRQYF